MPWDNFAYQYSVQAGVLDAAVPKTKHLLSLHTAFGNVRVFYKSADESFFLAAYLLIVNLRVESRQPGSILLASVPSTTPMLPNDEPLAPARVSCP